MLSYLILLYQWVLKRLPKQFSIPLGIFLTPYFIFVFPLLAVRAVPKVEHMISQKVPTISIPRSAFLEIPPDYSVVGGIVSAALMIIIAVIGGLNSYGVAALLYRIIRVNRKSAESGQAFRLMFGRPAELRHFFYRDRPTPDWIRVARVDSQGEVTYLMDC